MSESASFKPTRLHRIFEAAFHIRPEEFKLVQSFFLYFTLVGMFYTLESTVGETLFLSRLDSQKAQGLLPWFYIGTSLGTVAFTLAYDYFEDRTSRIRLIIGSQLLLAGSVLAFRQMVALGQSWVYLALVV